MMNEIKQKIIEQTTLEQKAQAFDTVVVLLDNAIGYMLESGESKENIAKYLLGVADVDMLDAISNEDYAKIIKLSSQDRKGGQS